MHPYTTFIAALIAAFRTHGTIWTADDRSTLVLRYTPDARKLLNQAYFNYSNVRRLDESSIDYIAEMIRDSAVEADNFEHINNEEGACEVALPIEELARAISEKLAA